MAGVVFMEGRVTQLPHIGASAPPAPSSWGRGVSG